MILCERSHRVVGGFSERGRLVRTCFTVSLDRDTSHRAWVLNLLYGNVSVTVAIALGFVGLFRYLRERREELVKREDERFEEVVKGLGGELDQQRVSSAVLLPTFLRKGYERFYIQVFNLAAGNLRGKVML